MKLPEILNSSGILSVDMTPDDMLPIRILEAYLDKSNEKWETDGLPENESVLYKIMNKHQDERRRILKNAINKLQKGI